MIWVTANDVMAEVRLCLCYHVYRKVTTPNCDRQLVPLNGHVTSQRVEAKLSSDRAQLSIKTNGWNQNYCHNRVCTYELKVNDDGN
jgi:hypothetical protein